MLVRIIDRPHRLILSCDHCKTEFERLWCTGKLKATRHFCSRRCQGYGSRAERETTSLKKYGATSAMKTQAVKDKLRATFQTKYGVKSASQIPGSEEKKVTTCLMRYGVMHPLQHSDFDERRKQTCLERYGVTTAFNTIAAREKNRSPETQRKKHETMKRNRTYGSSKPEEACYAALCEMFGVDDVERQATLHKWPIDFHVKSTDTWIQLDGIYWHGLDRPIEEIRASTSERDAQIHKKWMTDRDQDAWCESHHVRLIRIRETDILSGLKEVERQAFDEFGQLFIDAKRQV